MRHEGVTIKGVGSALPATILTNRQLELTADTTDAWIQENLGITERRIVVDGEDVSDLGVLAALRALDNAGIDKEDIDLIIVATSSPERISPSTACAIHKKLGISRNTPSFDVNAVCAGFVFALGIAAPMISSGMYKNILLIATEAYSKITDYSHRNCVFFGDGAGAVVLGQSDKGWMFVELESNGGGTGDTGFNCSLDAPYVTEPSEVWNQAISVLPNSIRSVLDKTDMKPTDVDVFIPHQASIRMLKLIVKEVGLRTDSLKTVMHKYGNIAGASIPITLDESMKNNEIKKGDRLLLTAIGSGWSWGSIMVNYE